MWEKIVEKKIERLGKLIYNNSIQVLLDTIFGIFTLHIKLVLLVLEGMIFES